MVDIGPMFYAAALWNYLHYSMGVGSGGRGKTFHKHFRILTLRLWALHGKNRLQNASPQLSEGGDALDLCVVDYRHGLNFLDIDCSPAFRNTLLSLTELKTSSKQR